MPLERAREMFAEVQRSLAADEAASPELLQLARGLEELARSLTTELRRLSDEIYELRRR